MHFGRISSTAVWSSRLNADGYRTIAATYDPSRLIPWYPRQTPTNQPRLTPSSSIAWPHLYLALPDHATSRPAFVAVGIHVS